VKSDIPVHSQDASYDPYSCCQHSVTVLYSQQGMKDKTSAAKQSEIANRLHHYHTTFTFSPCCTCQLEL